MTEDVNLSQVREVQTNLEKYVKKPPLTEKLLKKPPFRYLHDLISAIIRETGFLKGLYTEDELNSNNVKDKDAKLRFLDKLISAVKTVTGKNVTARSAKIIAGLEVSKTLELLSIIGKAIDEKVDFSAAMKVPKTEPKRTQKPVTETGKNIKNVKSTAPKRRGSEATKDTNISEPAQKNLISEVKSSEKVETNEAGANNHESSTLKNTARSPKIKHDTKRESSVQRQDTEGSSNLSELSVSTENHGNLKGESRNRSLTRKHGLSEKSNASSRKNSGQSKSSPSRKSSTVENNRNLNSAKNIIQEEENNNLFELKETITKTGDTKTVPKNDIRDDNTFTNDETNQTKAELQGSELSNSNQNEKPSIKRKEIISMPRPGSARPGSRRFSYSSSLNNGEIENLSAKEVKSDKKLENVDAIAVPVSRPRTAIRPPSARPGAPRVRDRGEVSVEDETKAPVNSVNVIEEGKQDQFSEEKDNFLVIESERSVPSALEESSVNDLEQGQLVHQILKTQKELNESVTVDNSPNKNSEIEWETGRQRERDIASKEIDRIRSFIQTLTSAANPLGKLFDFLQEDVDEMQRELYHWKKINENLQKQQLAEMEIGKMFLQPLQKQLEDVENSIQDEHIQIANAKNSILLNDDKILKLITGPKTRSK